MKIRQAKLATSIRGETSNILENTKYNLEFDKMMLTATLKYNPKGIGPFTIFPANIAYIEWQNEEIPLEDKKKK